MNAQFRITERRDMLLRRRWRWNLVAENGEVVAVSEAYNSLESAVLGAHVVQAISTAALIVVVQGDDA